MLITFFLSRQQAAIVQAFRQAAATTAQTACSADQLGLKPGMAWYQLVAKAVLRSPAEGRWFVDLAGWETLRRQRRRLGWMLVVALIVLLVLAWMGGQG